MDLWALKETWLDKFYERHGIVIEDGWKVIDIGAGYGDFSIRAAFDKPSSSIYAIEPFIESYNLLKKNLEKNKIGNISTFPLAIWSKTGEIILDLTNGEPLQSPTVDVMEKSINSKQIKRVQAVSLPDFINGNKIAKVDLLKIDCEGAEYEILCGCESEILLKIDRITMEYHDGFQGHTHNELVDLLSAHDFKVICETNIVHDNIGYLYATRKSLRHKVG
ncbi:MAG: FkbM family methyltransferase [Anaerolineaceae bacterium]|nr:FkbM family methyltransferase [Anaerolineaceae bacterium]